ncbi:tyrosine-type recombinase/integrase [Alteromonas lipotrueiana]|uniref:tyrosine-type recombinase/integrase n=1 Tax=Alteromonas lipotrueiana TaxID=2803815 RepID=UPI001C493DF2|nr:site-specific integrase [Alteromonas lipotrueiana]
MQKKNFIIVGDITDGLILDKDGNPFQPFKVFVNHAIEKDLATNTVKIYAEHVLRFLNYIYRAMELATTPLSRYELRQLIYSYTSYLVHAGDSPNEIARTIALENNRTKKLQISSIAPIDNAITYFIQLGELMQDEDGADQVIPLLDAIRSRRSAAERSKIKNNSMLAGVLRGDLSNKERVQYGFSALQTGGKKSRKSKKYITRSIALEQIAVVVDAAPNLRDKTFYALLAASGCRSHEALQVRLEDIDISTKEVFLRPPSTPDRNNLGLTIKEQEQLSWKGRATETTFLIEPFKSMFFNCLTRYIKEERVSTCGHTFLFQNKNTLRPHFCSDRSSRIKQFKAALKHAGIIDTQFLSPHSLRHSYGYYTLNYIPVGDGVFGLPLAYVQELMGHSSIESTKIYSKRDEDITKEMVDYANSLMFGVNTLSSEQIRIKFYESKLRLYQGELEKLYLAEGMTANV